MILFGLCFLLYYLVRNYDNEQSISFKEIQKHTLIEDKFIVVKFGQLAVIDESPLAVTRLHLAKFRDVNPLQLVAMTLIKKERLVE